MRLRTEFVGLVALLIELAMRSPFLKVICKGGSFLLLLLI